MNKNRIKKVVEDSKECMADLIECVDILSNNENAVILKLGKGNFRSLFLSYHTILEDFISLMLKELNKYAVNIDVPSGLKILNDNNVIDDNIMDFLLKSRSYRNRITHRYKEPSHDELLKHFMTYKSEFARLINVYEKVYLECIRSRQ